MTPIDSRRRRRWFLRCLIVMATFGSALSTAAGEQRFPDVVAVEVRPSGPDQFDFDVTVSSPYDTPKRYADGFRVYASGNRVLGERKLLHDHQNEQPFTRELRSIRVPAGIKRVFVQARDLKHGYGGKVAEVTLPGR